MICMVVCLVRVKGLEPLRRKTLDPKSSASAIPPHSHEVLKQYIIYMHTFQDRKYE